MRRVASILALVIFVAGCASLDTNRKRIAAADQGFQIALNTVNGLYDSGVISPSDWEAKVIPARDAVNQALDVAWDAADGPQETFLEKMLLLNQALDAFIKVRMEAEDG